MRRWMIVLVVLIAHFAVMSLVFYAAAALLLQPLEVRELLSLRSISFIPQLFATPEWLLGMLVFVGPMQIAQLLFLLPFVRNRPLFRGNGSPLKRTLMVVGLLASVLTVGLLAGWSEFIVTMFFIDRGQSEWQSMANDAGHVTVNVWWVWPLLLAASWVFWSLLLAAYARRRRQETPLSRWIAWLFAGTAIEMIVVLPLDVMIRRRTDCYCYTGTYLALLIGTWALLWLTGPAAVLRIFAKRRRRFDELHCRRCSHEKGPTPGAHCPECGFAWRGAQRSFE